MKIPSFCFSDHGRIHVIKMTSAALKLDFPHFSMIFWRKCPSKNPIPLKIFLTTERSEVVPFLRAVRAMKRGHEATPQGGGAPPSWSRSDPTLLGGCPPFVSSSVKSCPKRQWIGTKLGRNVLWTKPDGLSWSLLHSATRGRSYLVRKVKILAFWPFLNDFDTTEDSRRDQGA